MKKCPIKNCREKIRGDNLMCRSHWLMVPWSVRDSVWHYFKINRGGPAHISACAQAIRCVEDAERQAAK
jgi:hypothetical protein